MLKNMIKASIKMLDGNQDAKVVCARALLEEIVAGMDTAPTVQAVPRDADMVPSIPVKESNKPFGEATVYEMEINEDKTIKKIVNLALEAKVKLDGVEMTHAQAIGKKFKKLEVL